MLLDSQKAGQFLRANRAMANQQNNKKRPLYKSFGESYNQNASSSKKMKKQLEEEDVYIVEYLTKDIEGEFCLLP